MSAQWTERGPIILILIRSKLRISLRFIPGFDSVKDYIR